MKTAVSIKDNVFERAEKYAQETRKSRSQLYSEAVEEYLNKREKESLRDKINAVCEEIDTSLDPAIKAYQNRAINREKW